jgi:hypothetical protein
VIPSREIIQKVCLGNIELLCRAQRGQNDGEVKAEKTTTNSAGGRNAENGLFKGPVRFAALYAVGAYHNGLDRAIQEQFLLLEVGFEDPFGSFMRVAVGIACDRRFAADFAFV